MTWSPVLSAEVTTAAPLVTVVDKPPPVVLRPEGSRIDRGGFLKLDLRMVQK